MQEFGPFVSPYGLDNHGIKNAGMVHWNFPTPALYEQAIRRGEATLAHGGALVTRTGHHTGRSANDKFIVDEPSSHDTVWWGDINRPMSEEQFDGLHKRMLAYLQGRDIFVQDCFAVADPKHRFPVRIITESAMHSLFARNMFFWATRDDVADFKPEFTVIQAARFHAEPETDGTRSGVFVVVNFAKRTILVGGTSYAGEIKKSIFSILNYMMPEKGILPMHCSANIGKDGDTAVFFGLSGTGKTTLSADSSRTLIGDDEHGWGPDGVFNFEDGCYAKVIKLNEKAEPEIYATTKKFGTILENVMMHMDDRRLDLDDDALTENTRASYPLSHIPNASTTGCGGHPNNVIMLTCDAFGVMPPVSRLTNDQAMYHFLSGYTAKLAGTEAGVKEPQDVFSACFGAPFLPRNPIIYSKMLGELLAKHDTKCWLVNTGWSGGGVGVGKRMEIAHTRAMINAALAGELDDVPVTTDPNFGLLVPQSCPGVPDEVLVPRNTWADKAAYDEVARDLTRRFARNFTQFEDQVEEGVRAAAIRAAD
ncbi:MAG: phosphoenolpyruvate carboxykinase [Rhodospirillales bacterium]|nr:phosphoenolpyruvate carboxykinase [Rhodospirillales bacterium]